MADSRRGQLAATLRALRGEAGLTQEALAGRAQLSVRTVSDLERGIHPTARHSTLAALARALGADSMDRLAEANAYGSRVDQPELPRSVAWWPDRRLVGREGEQELLRQLWRAPRAGPAVALVSGEAGIGKSALLSSLARFAHEQGGTVAAGRAREGLADPYRPFLEAMASVDQVVAARLGHDLLAGGELPSRWEPFERVRAWAASLARDRAGLLVLDDLHWAQPSDLLLLRHLVLTPGTGNLVVVLAARSGATPIGQLVKELSHEVEVAEVPLGGLDLDEVAMLAELRFGRDGSTVAQRMWGCTRGNPFLVVNLLDRLEASGGPRGAGMDDMLDLGTVVELGRDLVEARLSCLTTKSVDLLRAAAVFGSEIDLDVLAHITGRTVEEVVELLDPASAAGILVPAPCGTGWSFDHDLVQQALLSSLSDLRKANLHHSIAGHLATTRGPVGAIAIHRLAALPLGDRGEAGRDATRAAQAAAHAMTWDEAATLHEAAASALEPVPGAERERAEALLAAGTCQQRAMARHKARPLLREAARLALAVDAVDLAAESARRYAHMTKAGRPDPTAEAMWRDGANRLTTSKGRASMLAALATELTLAGRPGESATAATRSRRCAVEAGDRAVLATAVAVESVSGWGRLHPARRLALAEEMCVLAEESGDVEMRLDAEELRGVPLLELGARHEFEQCADVLWGEGSRLQRRISMAQSAQWRSMVAAMGGDAARAQVAADQACDLAGGAPNFLAGHAGQTFVVARLRGLDGEVLGAMDGQLDDADVPDVWRAMAAVTAVRHGREQTAMRYLDRVLSDGLRGLRHDWSRVATVALAAEACVLVGAAEDAPSLASALEPFAGTLVVVASGVSCEGAVDSRLGLLAAAGGEAASARRLFAAGAALEERVHAPRLAARTRAWAAGDLSAT